MPAALFVNTPSADYKLVNRVLLHLRDWEYGEDPSWDNFHLIKAEILPETVGQFGTQPPIAENDLSNNIWANKSISDIQSFMLTERGKKNKENELNLNTFVILDEQGVKDGTVVLLDSPYNGDEDKMEERFNKVRVPWKKTYIMWCNLDIANMNFEDFVEDEEGDEVDWWTYAVDQDEETEEEKNVKEKRNSAIAELEQKGMV